jgi:hypothetical protein
MDESIITQKTSPIQNQPGLYQSHSSNQNPTTPVNINSTPVMNSTAGVSKNPDHDNLVLSSKKSKTKDLPSPAVGTYPPALAEKKLSNQQIVIQDVDFYSTALLIRLLEK